jgi:hypothetical protein
MSIDLPNMSTKEIVLLNKIWSCDSLDEFKTWKKSLCESDQLLANDLLFALSAEIELQEEQSYAEAQQLIEKIKRKL